MGEGKGSGCGLGKEKRVERLREEERSGVVGLGKDCGRRRHRYSDCKGKIIN